MKIIGLATTTLPLLFVAAAYVPPDSSTTAIRNAITKCRQCTRRSKEKFAWIAHDDYHVSSFWAGAKIGADLASQFMGIPVDALYPSNLNSNEQASLIADSPSKGYTGIATTLTELEKVPAAIFKNNVQGFSNVVGFNGGSDWFKNNSICYVGQDNYVAGYYAGLYFAKLGKKQGICINHAFGNEGCVQRCKGLDDGLKTVGGSVVAISYVDERDEADIISKTLQAFAENSGADCIMTLGSNIAVLVYQAVYLAGKTTTPSGVAIGTFDVGLMPIKAIMNGTFSFVLDQQQFVQGFFPPLMNLVTSATKQGVLPGEYVLSGPAIITQSTAATVYCSLVPSDASCGAISQGNGNHLNITLLVHGTISSDSYWESLVNGASQAATDSGIDLIVKIDTTYSKLNHVSAFSNAASSSTNGIIFSNPDTAALQSSISLAVSKNIPLINVGSGYDSSLDSSLLTSFGSNPYKSGYELGTKLAVEKKVTFALCINHQSGNMDIAKRCQGLADALADNGGKVYAGAGSNDTYVAINNVNLAIFNIQNIIDGNPTINAIVAFGTAMGETVVQFKSTLASPKIIAAYAASPTLAAAVHAGDVAYLIQDQPYAQGYFAVMNMALYLKTKRFSVVNSLVPTGPVFITMDNVISYSCQLNSSIKALSNCATCPGNGTCNGKGICEDNGSCTCNSGFTGSACDQIVSKPLFVESNSGLAIAYTALASIAVFFNFVLACIVVYHRKNAVIKASSPLFCVAILLGSTLVYLSIIPTSGLPTKYSCMANLWLLPIGFGLILGNLIVKNWRVYRIFYKILVLNDICDTKNLRDKELVKLSGLIVSVEIILAIIWSILGASPAIVASNAGSIYACQFHSTEGVIGSFFAYNLMLLLIAAYLGYKTQDIQSEFNESKMIAFSIYNILFCCVIGVPLVSLSSHISPVVEYAIVNGIILLGNSAFIAINFLPKWRLIFASKEVSAMVSARPTPQSKGAKDLTSNLASVKSNAVSQHGGAAGHSSINPESPLPGFRGLDHGSSGNSKNSASSK